MWGTSHGLTQLKEIVASLMYQYLFKLELAKNICLGYLFNFVPLRLFNALNFVRLYSH